MIFLKTLRYLFYTVILGILNIYVTNMLLHTNYLYDIPNVLIGGLFIFFLLYMFGSLYEPKTDNV